MQPALLGEEDAVRGLGFRPERVEVVIDDEVQDMVLRRSRVAAVSVVCDPGTKKSEHREPTAWAPRLPTLQKKSGVGPPPSRSPTGTLPQLCRDGRRRGRVDGGGGDRVGA